MKRSSKGNHQQRALFLAMEASFTVAFNAKPNGKNDELFRHLLPWARDTVEWVALCSGFPTRRGK